MGRIKKGREPFVYSVKVQGEHERKTYYLEGKEYRLEPFANDGVIVVEGSWFYDHS